MLQRSFSKYSKSRSVLDKRTPSWPIFDFYCRQQATQKSNSSFQQIEAKLHALNIGKFGRICKQLGLKLTRQEMVNTFQAYSVTRVMSYQRFNQALQFLQRENSGLDKQVERLALSIQQRSKMKLEPSSYEFKINSHSGKDVREILEELQARRKRRLNAKIQAQVSREKRSLSVLRNMGLSRFHSSRQTTPSQKTKTLSMANRSGLSNRRQSRQNSLHVSPPDQSIDLKVLLDEEQDQYLDSLYKPKRASILLEAKNAAQQLDAMQDSRQQCSLLRMNRQRLKKVQLGNKVLNKYKF